MTQEELEKEYPFVADNGQRYKRDPILGRQYAPTPFEVKTEIIDGVEYRFETKEERKAFFNKKIAELVIEESEREKELIKKLNNMSAEEQNKYLKYSIEKINKKIENSDLDEEGIIDTKNFLEDEWSNKKDRLAFIVGLEYDGIINFD